jgi:thiol-disulfide isomerase/thioredoxin
MTGDPTADPAAAPPVLVVCLCAEWCGVCREYRAAFEQVRARLPALRFEWVDVEDQADLVDPVEVDDFPTLLIARGDQAVFFGTMLPRADRLERQLREVLASSAPALAPAPAKALLERLREGLVQP